jgi:hypothetical protein
MNQTTSQTGAIGELQFAINCLKRGINASMPVLHNSRYDVVTEYNGLFYRVQVKSTLSKDLDNSNTISWVMDSTYSSKEIDFFAFYISDKDTNIIVPIHEVDGKRRIRYTEGGKYEKYINAFELLKQ